MNWHYTIPAVNGDYLCCVKDYSFPFPLTWYNGEWGDWSGDALNAEFVPLDNNLVVCYTSFQEIPMPENW